MSLREQYAREVEEFIDVANLLSEKGHVTSHGGNMAWRLEEKVILITPTKKNKGLLEFQDPVFISPDGVVIEGDMKPTGETPMYLLLFSERKDIKAIIHAHPRAASSFAITKGPNYLARPILPETVTEVGPVPVCKYAEPLTTELADHFRPFLDRHNAFLMENHGLLAMSFENIRRAYDLIEIIEATAESILWAASLGPVKEISPEEVRNLEKTMRTRDLPSIGRPHKGHSLMDLYYPQG